MGFDEIRRRTIEELLNERLSFLFEYVYVSFVHHCTSVMDFYFAMVVPGLVWLGFEEPIKKQRAENERKEGISYIIEIKCKIKSTFL